MAFFIDRGLLLDISGQLMDGHISYGFGSKAPSLNATPSEIKRIDCSGFVRYLIYQATDRSLTLPDGSYVQRDWCKHHKLEHVAYSTASESDGWLRIGFIAPKAGHAGHVWLILNGWTLESHGSTGPDSRRWNTHVLLSGADGCYKFAHTYSITVGPVTVN